MFELQLNVTISIDVIFLEYLGIPILFVIFLIIRSPAIRDFYLIYLDRFAISKASTYLNSVTVGKKIWHGKNGWDEMPESTEATVCITSPFIYARPFVVFHFKVHLSSSREQSGRIEIKKSIDTFFPPESFTSLWKFKEESLRSFGS